MTRFHVPHKSVYSQDDRASWPFCLLEEHLIPRLSSYWKSHLPQRLMGCSGALRRFYFYFPCGEKKTQTRSTKCTFKVTFFIFLLENNALCCSKVMLTNTGKWRNSQCDWMGRQTLKKNLQPGTKKYVTGNFPSHSFLFSRHRDYYSLCNLSDLLHFLQIFSFVVRSFRFTQAKMVYGASETKILAKCRLCSRPMLAAHVH